MPVLRLIVSKGKDIWLFPTENMLVPGASLQVSIGKVTEFFFSFTQNFATFGQLPEFRFIEDRQARN